MALRRIPTRTKREHQETGGAKTPNEREAFITERTTQVEGTVATESTKKEKHFCTKIVLLLLYEFGWSGIILAVLCLFQQNCKECSILSYPKIEFSN